MSHRTICAVTRRYVPPALVIPLWSAFTAWIVPHLLRGYVRDRPPRSLS